MFEPENYKVLINEFIEEKYPFGEKGRTAAVKVLMIFFLWLKTKQRQGEFDEF